ncbi:MAG TPA: CusA/CzcA family heavy metal efflux RND transporter, partial [Methylophaga aminisulfidivorans]|nr:CusA/CzcA family heavy metal efflux RND transporter [Methylophaga aminisulfidivorans]
MISSILRLSIERRSLMLSLIVLLVFVGTWSYKQLPIDAVPDITNVQVQINTKAPGYSPLEAEQRITYPIERALSGLPGLDYTRSISRYGLSQVTVVFKEGTNLYFARDRLTNRLANIKNMLPVGLEPEMGPIASGLGEIFVYTVSATPEAKQENGQPYDLTALREIQDWIIQPRLMQVKGITEVNTMGGYDKQYHVMPKPQKLLQFGVTLEALNQALKRSNTNRGAGYVERNGQQLLIRSPGQLNGIHEIEQVVIKAIDTIPVTVADVADVAIGHTLRTGAATQNGHETVMATAMMLIGENARDVAKRVANELASIQTSLPDGVVANAVYDRTTLVDKAIATVQKNLLEGALLVIVVLFLLLGNIRAALITAAVIPLAMLATITGMVQAGISANLMSLGALDFGLIVDGAVIIVENAIRRLSLAQKGQETLPLNERLAIVFDASNEVIRPSLFGMLIITVVYIPLFSFTGVEGKMFTPMAATVVIALLAAMLMTLTLVPAAVALFINGKIEEKESIVVTSVKSLYRPLLIHSLKLRWIILLVAFIAVVGAGFLTSKMGTEFVPQLNEGDIALHALRTTGTSLQQSIDMQILLEKRIKRFHEVANVFAKIGTPEVATDPMPPNVADTFIILKPREQWPNPAQSKNALLTKIEEDITQLPGNNYEFTQPIEMRFNELISGVRADVAVKVFGDDLSQLNRTAEIILAELNQIPGAADARVEQTDALPMISIEPKRMALARYGLTVDELQHVIATFMGGEELGVIYEGARNFKLVTRLATEQRDDIEGLADIPIQLSNGRYVPLSEVATVNMQETPSQISRENV